MPTFTLAIKDGLYARLSAYKDNDRAIVFVQSVARAEALAEFLKCGSYSSVGEDKDAVFKRWIKGNCKHIVSTTSLRVGIGVSSIREVYFENQPYTLLDFGQQSS